MSMVMGQIIDSLGINFMFVGFAVIQAVNVGIVVICMPSPSKEDVAADAAKQAAEEAAEAAEGGSGGSKFCNLNVMWFFANLIMYGISMCLIEIPVFKYMGPYLEKQPEGSERAMTLILFGCQ